MKEDTTKSDYPLRTRLLAMPVFFALAGWQVLRLRVFGRGE
jgi:hypothetical protein